MKFGGFGMTSIYAWIHIVQYNVCMICIDLLKKFHVILYHIWLFIWKWWNTQFSRSKNLIMLIHRIWTNQFFSMWGVSEIIWLDDSAEIWCVRIDSIFSSIGIFSFTMCSWHMMLNLMIYSNKHCCISFELIRCFYSVYSWTDMCGITSNIHWFAKNLHVFPTAWLTHLLLVPHICASESGQHCFR